MSSILLAFTVHVSLSPQTVSFDLESFNYPPPIFPYYYPSLEKTNTIKIEYELEPEEKVEFLEVYIKGEGELPGNLKFSNFLFSTSNIPLPDGKDISGWTPLSSFWKKVGEFPLKERKGEIIFPLNFILKIDESTIFYGFEKFNLKFNLRINGK